MEKESIVNLVESAQAGNSDAISALFAAYKNEVYSIAMRETKNRALSDDIVQETFVEVILKINDLKNPASFPAWLKIMAYHQCTRHYKKKETVHETAAIENDEGWSVFDEVEETNAAFIPDEALDQKEFKATILEMIDDLPDAQRAALHMFYFEEMPLKVIAKIQGVSVNTANTRLNRGRLAMKDSIEKYEKKHGVRLHSIAFFPFFKWLLKGSEKTMPAKSATRVAENISVQTGVSVATVETSAMASAVAAGGKTAVSGVVTKIVAGVAAASVAISAPFIVSNIQDKKADTSIQNVIVAERDNAQKSIYQIGETIPTEAMTGSQNLSMEYYAPVFDQYQNLLSHEYTVDTETGAVQEPVFATDLTSWLLFHHGLYLHDNGNYVWREDFKVYYALEDLNYDGIDELFIGAGNSIDSVNIYSLLSNDGQKPIKLVDESSLGERSRMTVYEDNTFAILGSGGAAYSTQWHYKLPKDSFVPKVINEFHHEDTVCYWIDENGNRMAISMEEFVSVMDHEGKRIKQLNWQEIEEAPIENEDVQNSGGLKEYLDFSKSWGIRKDMSSPEFQMEQVFDFAFLEDGTFCCFFYQQYSDFLVGFNGTYIFKDNHLTLSFVKEGEITNQYTYYFEPQAMTLTLSSESGLWGDKIGTVYLLANDEWYPTSQDVISAAEMAIAWGEKEKELD